MGDVPAMEDIYFQAYNDQMQETVIHRPVRARFLGCRNAGQCTISDDGRTVSYFRNHAKRIILYDTVIFAI